MEFIRRKAWNMRIKNHITHLPLQLEDMMKIARNNGWDLYSYLGAAELLNNLQLEVYAKLLRAFAIMDGTSSIILYQDELGYYQKLFAIAHEFGHIYLHHTYFGIMGDSEDRDVANDQENEANLFALELLVPSCILCACCVKTPEDLSVLNLLNLHYEKKYMEKVYSYKKFRCYDNLYKSMYTLYREEIQMYRAALKAARQKRYARQNLPKTILNNLAIGAISTIVLTAVILWISTQYQNSLYLLKGVSNGQYHDKAVSFLAGVQEPNQIKVYVTEDGKKYHRTNCQYLQGRQVRELTLKEALEQGYQPCEVCNP